MQRSHPGYVLCYSGGAVLDKELCDFYMFILGSQMQRHRLVIEAPRIHILRELDDQDLNNLVDAAETRIM